MKKHGGNHFNIASYLPVMAEKHPFKKAVVCPKGRDITGRRAYAHYTFSQLERESNRCAAGFSKLGIKKGDRVVLLVRPGLQFIMITYALFKSGAVPVLIDPGMGSENLFQCIAEVKPRGFVAVPAAHAARMFNKKYFSSVRHFVTVGKRWFWGGASLDEVLEAGGDGGHVMAETMRGDPAAILFTTGSTGAPKGVVYEHGMFDAQVRIIQNMYAIDSEDVDLPAFPLFALFDTAWGITSVIPDMDPSKPAQVDPEKIIEAVNDQGVTITFGSPAIWNRVGKYCTERGITLPSIKRILMAGAPVPGALLERFRDILPDGETHTPYGATEALPVASITGSEITRETFSMTEAGKGCCVGRPAEGITVKIIKLTDDVIFKWDEKLLLPQGEIGEIAVMGDVVTKEYFGKKKPTALAKISDGDTFWHRMGDTGYIDDGGRIWFCGRKAHRVEVKGGTLFPVMCEGVFNRHDDVFRSALVGVGKINNRRPVIIIQPHEGCMPGNSIDEMRFKEELLELGKKYDITKNIKDILFHPSFPVDIRHNAKIFREKLALWAEERLR